MAILDFHDFNPTIGGLFWSNSKVGGGQFDHSVAMRRLFHSVLRVSCFFIQSSADTEHTLNYKTDIMKKIEWYQKDWI